MKKKIAIVNQRYGVEVNGGSEQYSREIAEHLLPYYDVEILTTCALEHLTWENYYPEGLSEINGVKVRRFRVEKPRDLERFGLINARVLTAENRDPEAENEWLDEQGPYCPQFLQYIEDKKDDYEVFLFVTYLYYLTVRGIHLVRDKAILIPTAHDEPYIRFGIFRDVFLAPRAIVFLTEEEKAFVHSVFHNEYMASEVAGVGIHLPDHIVPELYKSKFDIDEYIVYVGRIEEGKGCRELFDFFLRYKEQHPSNLKLVLMGKAIMEIPQHPDIITLGFVSDEDKFSGIAGAKLLVLPSLFESLSMSVLEALTLGVPILVNGGCAVLRGHCQKSNAGLYYTSYDEFADALTYGLTFDDNYLAMSAKAKKYVSENYNWRIILDKLRRVIDQVHPIKVSILIRGGRSGDTPDPLPKSIAKQSYQNSEIIFVHDDCTPDQASGEYMLYLNPDDNYDVDFVDRIVQACIGAGGAVCVSKFDVFPGNIPGTDAERVGQQFSSTVREKIFRSSEDCHSDLKAAYDILEEKYGSFHAESESLREEANRLLNESARYKAEYERVQGELDWVRRSRTYKLSRAIGKPLRLIRNRRKRNHGS